nr:photosystem II protein Psb30 [Cyanidiaceae sp.]
MLNWQVIAQLTFLALIITAGPGIIVYLSTRENNLL